MRRYLIPTLNAALLLAWLFLLAGCFKDTCTKTYRIYVPVYKTNAEVRANIKSNIARQISSPGKIFTRGKYIFLNEADKGVHIIDNSNPSAPKNVAFIDLPGNLDIAVKGNTLYADLYTDLVTLDITDPLNVSVKKIIDNTFPERRYTNGFTADTTRVITDWLSRDTTVTEDCDNGSRFWSCTNCMVFADASSAMAQSKASAVGVGGSMARFTIVNNSLYTVNNSTLAVYNITSAENPVGTNNINLGWGIETIYPFKDKLFIGSTTGMFIYDISNPNSPSKLGQFTHARACDPVIADDKFAYVTLSAGTRCANASNQLDVLDISNLSAPSLVKTYPMTNPLGLSKDANTLFICDGKDGLKLYDASNSNDLKLVNHLKGFQSYDIITGNNLAIVVTREGLLQYDYSDVKNLKLLSSMGWEGAK